MRSLAPSRDGAGAAISSSLRPEAREAREARSARPTPPSLRPGEAAALGVGTDGSRGRAGKGQARGSEGRCCISSFPMRISVGALDRSRSSPLGVHRRVRALSRRRRHLLRRGVARSARAAIALDDDPSRNRAPSESSRPRPISFIQCVIAGSGSKDLLNVVSVTSEMRSTAPCRDGAVAFPEARRRAPHLRPSRSTTSFTRREASRRDRGLSPSSRAWCAGAGSSGIAASPERAVGSRPTCPHERTRRDERPVRHRRRRRREANLFKDRLGTTSASHRRCGCPARGRLRSADGRRSVRGRRGKRRGRQMLS